MKAKTLNKASKMLICDPLLIPVQPWADSYQYYLFLQLQSILPSQNQSPTVMTQRNLYEQRLGDNSGIYGEESHVWDYHYRKIVSGLQGTDIEKEAIIRKRILRFFGEFKIDSEAYLSFRSDINYRLPGLQIIPNILVLYGIDYMNIQRARNYFAGFITNIRRMDDSHFIVEFRNDLECLAAVNKYKRDSSLPSYTSPQNLMDNSSNGWVDMVPYFEFIFERKLMARYCTTVDRTDNIPQSTKQSFIFAYSEAKRKFMKNLKQDCSERQQRRKRLVVEISNSRNQQNNHKNGQNTDQSNDYRKELQKKNNYRSRSKEGHQGDSKSAYRHGKNYGYNRRQDNRMRSRSRGSSSHSRSSQCQLERRLQEQIIKESDFKFKLYIQKRNNKKTDGSFDKRALAALDFNNKKSIYKEKSRETNYDDDVELIESKKSIFPNESQLNFSRILQNLKLEDTVNDYSAFDLEIPEEK